MACRLDSLPSVALYELWCGKEKPFSHKLDTISFFSGFSDLDCLVPHRDFSLPSRSCLHLIRLLFWVALDLDDVCAYGPPRNFFSSRIYCTVYRNMRRTAPYHLLFLPRLPTLLPIPSLTTSQWYYSIYCCPEILLSPRNLPPKLEIQLPIARFLNPPGCLVWHHSVRS